jgi:protein-S-isoprenylcysteine O-methyltransferase Ste14
VNLVVQAKMKRDHKMRKLKHLMSFMLLALLMSLLLFWLSIRYTFSLAYPLSYLPHGSPDWGFVVLNIILFSLFVLFIRFKRRVTRLPASVYLAFIVALFAEMYGFPLTMYIITWLVGYTFPGCLWYPIAVLTGEDLFVSIFLGFILPISNMIILIGILLLIFGWSKIYRARGQLVTTGIYGYVRHPQYLGFLLLTLGMNVLWIAISTVLLWPILAILYYRLAKEEDKELEERFGEEYRKYKRMVPMLIPRMHRART